MHKWRVKLPGGRTFTLESDNPGQDLIAQGHTAFSLEEIAPPPLPRVELPKGSWKSHPLLLTVPQAAELLQVGRDTMYSLTHVEGFPALRIGHAVRINRDALQAWIDENNGGVLL